jgi:hypothetical protein
MHEEQECNVFWQVATAAGLKTAWSDKEIQYQVVAGPGDPLNLGDRITDTFFPAIDYVNDKLVCGCSRLA